MSAAAAAAEEEAVIRKRLIWRASVARGDPPLKKLAKRQVSLLSAAASGGGGFEEAVQAFLKELSQYEFQAKKTAAVDSVNQREQQHYEALQNQLREQVEKVSVEIEALKVELESAQKYKQEQEEYEGLRKICSQHPPQTEEKELAGLEEEAAAASRTLDLRKKQFALLLHVMDDLTSALAEDDTRPEARAATPQLPATESAPEAMVVDS
eukprot:jgi/Chlat1/1625/Chrsp127S01945